MTRDTFVNAIAQQYAKRTNGKASEFQTMAEADLNAFLEGEREKYGATGYGWDKEHAIEIADEAMTYWED